MYMTNLDEVSNNKNDGNHISPSYRRNVIETSGALVVAALAGCQEADSSPGDPDVPTATATATEEDTEAGANEATATETDEDGGETPEETAEDTEESDGEDGASDWYVRPEGEPQHVPAGWNCDDEEAERQPQLFDEDALSWGEDPERRWELRIDDIEFEHGAEVHVRLRNVTDEEQYTPNHDAYNLQIETDGGWEDVRVWRDGQPKPHPGEQTTHDPGDGFDWQFVVTEAEFDDREIEVCPALETARYRFAFEYHDDEGIAVGFDLDAS